MGKTSKVVICGLKGIGKTVLIHRLIYGSLDYEDIHPTIEDMYAATILNDKGSKETMRIYDTEGVLPPEDANAEATLPRHLYNVGDAFVMVYNQHNVSSFATIETIKRDLEKFRDKREVITVAVGLRRNLPSSEAPSIDSNYIANWAAREKVKHFDCQVANRETLFPPFVYVASKLNTPHVKPTFTPLGMVRKPKDAVSLAANSSSKT